MPAVVAGPPLLGLPGWVQACPPHLSRRTACIPVAPGPRIVRARVTSGRHGRKEASCAQCPPVCPTIGRWSSLKPPPPYAGCGNPSVPAMRILAVVLGAVVVVTVVSDAIGTLVVTQGRSAVWRPARLWYAATWRVARAVAARAPARAGDVALDVYPAASLLGLLVLWLAGLV